MVSNVNFTILCTVLGLLYCNDKGDCTKSRRRFRSLKLTSLVLCAVWDSAIVLAKYLEKWPETVVGKQCIELGAGCGLAGADY